MVNTYIVCYNYMNIFLLIVEKNIKISASNYALHSLNIVLYHNVGFVYN